MLYNTGRNCYVPASDREFAVDPSKVCSLFKNTSHLTDGKAGAGVLKSKRKFGGESALPTPTFPQLLPFVT